MRPAYPDTEEMGSWRAPADTDLKTWLWINKILLLSTENKATDPDNLVENL